MRIGKSSQQLLIENCSGKFKAVYQVTIIEYDIDKDDIYLLFGAERGFLAYFPKDYT